jgi:hypothetical protein
MEHSPIQCTSLYKPPPPKSEWVFLFKSRERRSIFIVPAQTILTCSLKGGPSLIDRRGLLWLSSSRGEYPKDVTDWSTPLLYRPWRPNFSEDVGRLMGIETLSDMEIVLQRSFSVETFRCLLMTSSPRGRIAFRGPSLVGFMDHKLAVARGEG